MINTNQLGYRCSKTIKKGSCTIQIFRPELDAKEQEKREAHLKAVAEGVLREYYIRKEGRSYR